MPKTSRVNPRKHYICPQCGTPVMTAKDIAKAAGKNPSTVYSRMKAGMTLQEALTTPTRANNRGKKGNASGNDSSGY